MYVEHSKHILEIIKVALFEEFYERNTHVKIAISMFQKLKLWFIRPNTISNMFCCWYHVEFWIRYDTFLEFCSKHWQGDPLHTIVCEYISPILCIRKLEELFYNKICVGGRRCIECCELALCEYVVIDQPYSSTMEPRRMNYLQDDIPI